MLLNAVDRIYGITQVVGKSFGFIDRNAAGVSQIDAEDGTKVLFAESAGWIKFELGLPHRARLVQAGTGIMTRWSIWKLASSNDLEKRLVERLRGLEAIAVRSGPNDAHWTIRRPRGEYVEIKLARADGTDTVAIRQTRTRVGVSESVKSTVA